MLKKYNFFNLSMIALIVISSRSVFASTLNDSGQINATSISKVIHIQSEAEIVSAIQKAKEKHLPIAIMGKQHSQGGQTLATNGIQLDMLPFNKVLGINIKNQQVTVQSGITWSELQKYINPYNLAIKSMQSPNIFTVGGSLSVNAHGDDFRSGPVGNSIVSFYMLLANGKKILVTPTSHPELWNSVRGGYGLLGIVTEVTLQLTSNNLLISHYREMDLNHFPDYFRKNILNNKKVTLFYAHLNIVPGPHFLQDMYVITYTDTGKLPTKIRPLVNPDKWNVLLEPLFNMSRHGKLGRKERWEIEKQVFKRVYNHHVVTRNNAMEKPITFASNYHSQYNADWLQEYFIPVNQLSKFMAELRKVASQNKINLLNVTIRYVPAEPTILLSYAKTDSFSVVLYFNQSLSKEAISDTKSWTQKLINVALSLGGNYYLTYQNFANKSMFKQAYPQYKNFLEIKKRYDPNGLFENKFYLTYFN